MSDEDARNAQRADAAQGPQHLLIEGALRQRSVNPEMEEVREFRSDKSRNCWEDSRRLPAQTLSALGPVSC